jgi:hypothetical protein
MVVLELGSPAELAGPRLKPVGSVRPATLADVDGLAHLELNAFPFLYDKSSGAAAAVRAMYADRVRLLGDWLLVWTHPVHGICGHLVLCPTRLRLDDFWDGALEHNDIASLRAAYDSDPTGAVVVSVGTLTGARGLVGGPGLISLFTAGARFCRAHGAGVRYFYSRVPGFARWLSSQSPSGNVDSLSEAERDRFVERYVRERRLGGAGAQSIDPLLSGYMSLGAKPLWIRRNHLPGDVESLGYSVFCWQGGPVTAGHRSAVVVR